MSWHAAQVVQKRSRNAADPFSHVKQGWENEKDRRIRISRRTERVPRGGANGMQVQA